MQTLSRHILILTILLVAPFTQVASNDLARGLLHADGILKVKGGNVADALITVIPANAPPYTLPKGTKRFDLELKLNGSYLVTFEHPQCLTKQLYFDTRVPADYKFDEYKFPFEVELEVEGRTKNKAYVGPVGYIRYKDPVNDFDYETDYTMTIDDRIQEQLAIIQQAAPSTGVNAAAERSPRVATVTPPAPPIEDPIVPDVVRVEEDGPPPVIEEAPTVQVEREPAPKPLEPLLAEPSPESVDLPEPVPAKIMDVPVRMDDVMEGPPTAPAKTPRKPAEKTEVAPRLPPQRGMAVVTQPDPSQYGRHEELIVDDNKVTTVVRIVNERGYGHEYRRVAHKFGPVFYFKDDQSITEEMYRKDTGMGVE